MSMIIMVPNETLRLVAKPVDRLDKRVLNIVKDMIKTLKEAKNPKVVGLAASQIGAGLRIFLIRPIKNGPITVFINPEITHYSQRTTHPTAKKGVYEGCLSIPNHYAPLERSSSVTVKYQTLTTSPLTPLQNFGEGNARGKVVEKTQVFSGFPAHVIQHEMDHLNGILFIDRCLEQNAKLYKSDGDRWQEITL